GGPCAHDTPGGVMVLGLDTPRGILEGSWHVFSGELSAVWQDDVERLRPARRRGHAGRPCGAALLVRGAGAEGLVRVPLRAMSRRTVVVGGVAGGMSTATRLRRLDEQREIVVL